MNNQPHKGPTDQTPPDTSSSSAVVLLLGDIANATWRMFVPTVSLLLAGRWLDERFDVAPWGVLIGAGVGFLLALWLVVRQLQTIDNN